MSPLRESNRRSYPHCRHAQTARRCETHDEGIHDIEFRRKEGIATFALRIRGTSAASPSSDGTDPRVSPGDRRIGDF